MGLVALVGAGGMGMGIAQLVLAAGHTVRLVDQRQGPLAEARAALASRLGRGAEGRLTGDPDEILTRLSTHLEVPEGRYDVLLEAVPERRDIKGEVIGQLLDRAPEDALVATTALAIPVRWLVGERNGRVLGFHFMNPAPALRLCELVVPSTVDRSLADAGRAFLEGLGLTVIEAPDQPGFVLNHTHVPFLLGAMERVEEGVPPADVDAVFVLGCRHPMGPLAIADLVGLDVLLAIAETLEPEGDRYYVPAVLRAMVQRGELGQKAGRGFYVYDA